MASIAAARAGPTGTGPGAPTSHPFTCNTCQVAFRNIDLQKSHMKGDWHRYNLKRRVASLPAISSEVFNEKVLQARAVTTAEADKVGFERPCDVCQKTYYSENAYRNHIGSQKHKAREATRPASREQTGRAFDEASSVISSTFSLGDPIPVNNGHKVELDPDAEEEFSQVIEGLKGASLKEQERTSPVKRPSNPHLSAAGQRKAEHPLSDQSEPSSETPSGSATPVNASKADGPSAMVKSCLFCNYESPTSSLNAVHMERIHGLVIPEMQYLVDLDGLLGALQQRVQELHECLYCGKVKATAFAVQTHMRDSSHCMIPFTTEAEQLEIGEFYDFRSTYSDVEDDDESEDGEAGQASGGARLGMKRPTKLIGEDGDELMDEGEGDGWETDSSASSLDSADLTAVPAEQHFHQYERLDKHPHHGHSDPRSHHQRDGWHSHAHKHTHAAFYDEYELHLPGGKSVGHRAHNRYYRQNLRNYPSAEERAELEEQERGRSRLAIEDGGAEPMDVDGPNNRLERRHGGAHGGSRALVSSRANNGLPQGVSSAKLREVARDEHRGRDVERDHHRRLDFKNNRRVNNQKHFHYSKLGG